MKSLENIILQNRDRPARLTLILVLPLVVLFTLLLTTFYIWDQRSRHRYLELQMKETAKAHFEQIVLTRLWNASYGGVYVAVTEDTQPNPYLDDPEKTIATIDGKEYTKLNPAYMTRQLSLLTDERRSFKIRMSGLNPINPLNRPDAWEAAMIRSFEEGEKEGFGRMQYLGRNYFRYMAPLKVTEECLGCHGKEGYTIGDVKGGISVSIPSAFLEALHKDLDRKSFIAFGAVGLVAISLLTGTTWVLAKRSSEGLRKEFEGERLKTAIKMAGAAAHELRQPMTIISGFSEILRDKVEDGKDIQRETEIIIEQCSRMNRIIARMLNVTTYRTKLYEGTTEIFDLGAEAEDEQHNP
jgi:hypothetical protein